MSIIFRRLSDALGSGAFPNLEPIKGSATMSDSSEDVFTVPADKIVILHAVASDITDSVTLTAKRVSAAGTACEISAGVTADGSVLAAGLVLGAGEKLQVTGSGTSTSVIRYSGVQFDATHVKSVFSGALATGNGTTLYTCPADCQAVILSSDCDLGDFGSPSLKVMNGHASTNSIIKTYVLPSGVSAVAQGYQVAAATTVNAGAAGTLSPAVNVLDEGESLVVTGDATNAEATVSGCVFEFSKAE